jgi:ABC-2 type transport system ATP-binding protein
LLDLIKPTKGKVINNQVDVSISEDWKSFTTAFLDETFLIGYLMPEEYFYFIGELRGLSKQKVDSFMSQFEDFFNGEILGGKKYLRDLIQRKPKKSRYCCGING